MKLRYLALAAAMAIASPAAAAPSSVIPTFGSPVTTSGVIINPKNGQVKASASEFEIYSGYYTLVMAAFSSFKGTGSFTSVLTNSAGAVVKSLHIDSTSSILYDATSFKLGTGTYMLTISGSSRRGSSLAAAGIFAAESPVAVPGPEAGTGLAAVAMAGIGALAYRRKQKMSA